MKRKLGVHKNIFDCKIIEMVNTDTEEHYFTAIICGWSGFKFISDPQRKTKLKSQDLFVEVCRVIKELRDTIKKYGEKELDKMGSIFYL